MLYRTYLPAPELRRYVKCFWMLRSATNPFPAAEPLIPDGSIELILNFGAAYRRSPLHDAGKAVLIAGSHVVGERTQPFLVEQLGAIEHMAIRFRPGGLYAFARVPVGELTNQVLECDLILGKECRQIEQRLFEATSDAERVALLNDLLRRRLRQADAREALARAATRFVSRRKGGVSVADVCAHVDCDYKQLERSFRAVVGLTPKFYSRLVRFLTVFDTLRNEPAAGWAQRALEFGYADQAHLVKEFKAFAGAPPTRFLARPGQITPMLTGRVSNSYKTQA